MHVEPPKAPLLSLKEFGLHYLMIVVSILTAIGLEEILRAYHNREAAEAAEQAIETELRGNLADLRQAIKTNRERREELTKLGDALAEEIRANKDPAALKQKVIDNRQLKLGLLLPALQHDAWDVAVASQAATLIPREKLAAYTDLYTTERESISGANSGMAMLDAPRLIDFQADAEIGIGDPKRMLELLREASAMNGVALGNLAAAEEEMTKTFEKAGLKP